MSVACKRQPCSLQIRCKCTCLLRLWFFDSLLMFSSLMLQSEHCSEVRAQLKGGSQAVFFYTSNATALFLLKCCINYWTFMGKISLCPLILQLLLLSSTQLLHSVILTSKEDEHTCNILHIVLHKRDGLCLTCLIIFAFWNPGMYFVIHTSCISLLFQLRWVWRIVDW